MSVAVLPGMLHRRLLLASLLLAASTSTALAQPSATAPGAAPQTHEWSDVSHINGQLVPVGESNSYLKKFRKTNVAANPIGWIVGIYGVSASHAVSDHVAIRGDVTYYSIVDSDDTGTELGIGVPLYLRRTYQGAFLEPGFIVRHWDGGHCDDGAYAGCDDTSTTAGPQVLFGWHWTWDSGLNVAAAFGLGRNLSSESDEYDYDDEEVFPNGYFRVGYAF
jgi:hypothetical protein